MVHEIKKLLIANRGEIVRRIIRTCRRMGIKTIAIFSEADRDAPYLSDADETVCIGPANPAQSYLNAEILVQSAIKLGADAIHPGYGFLSERGAFAQAVQDAGLIWVGPSPELLKQISSKSFCRRLADKVGVPIVPGTLAPIEGPEEVERFASEHGYPLLLKLDKGGGGKGLLMVAHAKEIDATFRQATSIGKIAFDSSACYVEKALPRVRHIEVQFLSDAFGNCVCLGERECSIQRRHQKIIEESPSIVVASEDRQKLFDWTKRIVFDMDYHGAGTIEYLRSSEGEYFFMEINARLQVEHPVTELLTGVDIVKSQLEIAGKIPLDLRQENVSMKGHAIECRIYAEDPDTFIPCPGTISSLKLPRESVHIRIDHALKAGMSVPPYYDPLLAKVIAWDHDRQSAIEGLIRALDALHIEGVKTTSETGLRILHSESFQKGEFDTSFLENS